MPLVSLSAQPFSLLALYDCWADPQVLSCTAGGGTVPTPGLSWTLTSEQILTKPNPTEPPRVVTGVGTISGGTRGCI